MSDREFGGNDDLSLPKGKRSSLAAVSTGCLRALSFWNGIIVLDSALHIQVTMRKTQLTSAFFSGMKHFEGSTLEKAMSVEDGLGEDKSDNWKPAKRDDFNTGSKFEQMDTATVQKIITEVLAATDPGSTFSKDARDTLISCCVEFITLISSEANEIAEKEAKKTIGMEHIKKALEDLGFKEYVPYILEVAADHKKQIANREKKLSKAEQSGLTEEELMQQQQELFRSATDKFNACPQESA